MSSKSVTTEIDQVKRHGETSVVGAERPVWYRIWRRRLQTKPRLNKASFLITHSLRHYPASQIFKMMSETVWMFLLGWDLMAPKMSGNQHWFQTGPVSFHFSSSVQELFTRQTGKTLTQIWWMVSCVQQVYLIFCGKTLHFKTNTWMLLDYRNRSMHCSLIIPYSNVSSGAKQLNILFSVGDSISISSYSLKRQNLPRTRPHCCQTIF